MVAGQQKLLAKVGKDGQVGSYNVGISEARLPDIWSRSCFKTRLVGLFVCFLRKSHPD